MQLNQKLLLSDKAVHAVEKSQKDWKVLQANLYQVNKNGIIKNGLILVAVF